MKKKPLLLVLFFYSSLFLFSAEYKIGDNDEILNLPDDTVLKEESNESGNYYFTFDKYPQILIQISASEKDYDEEEAIANLKDKMKKYDVGLVKEGKTVYLEYTVIPDEKKRSLDNEDSMVLFMWEIYKSNRYYLMSFLLKYKDLSDTPEKELKEFGRVLIKGIKDLE